MSPPSLRWLAAGDLFASREELKPPQSLPPAPDAAALPANSPARGVQATEAAPQHPAGGAPWPQLMSPALTTLLPALGHCSPWPDELISSAARLENQDLEGLLSAYNTVGTSENA